MYENEKIIQLSTCFCPGYKQEIQIFGVSDYGNVYYFDEEKNKWVIEAHSIRDQLNNNI